MKWWWKSTDATPAPEIPLEALLAARDDWANRVKRNVLKTVFGGTALLLAIELVGNFAAAVEALRTLQSAEWPWKEPTGPA